LKTAHGNTSGNILQISRGCSLGVEGQQPKLDPLAERKRITFEQAEGVAPLPSQLKRGEISQEFRAVIWRILEIEFERATPEVEWGESGIYSIGQPWLNILRDAHTLHHHELGYFRQGYREVTRSVRDIIGTGSWSQVLGWLEFVLKHPARPEDFAAHVNDAMTHCRLAYRVFDAHVICPIGSDAERQTIKQAFADLTATEFGGAGAHLRKAAEGLTAGQYADSVRESIHAVESVARVLEPNANLLSTALAKLEKSATIHPAMKSGFNSLYGYTSDEKGVRHAMLEADQPAVALFMIGACAAFVSYMINKARKTIDHEKGAGMTGILMSN